MIPRKFNEFTKAVELSQEITFGCIKCTYHIFTVCRRFLKFLFLKLQFSSGAQLSNSLRPRGLQHARPPCPSPTPGVYTNSCPLSWWCHLTISSSIVPSSSCLQSFPASGSFQMSQFFASGGQNIGVSASASVLPVNIQDWSPLGWTAWISLQSKGLSKVFSNPILRFWNCHAFF